MVIYRIKAEVDSFNGSVDYWVMRKWFIFWCHIHPYPTKIDAEDAIRKLTYGNR